MFPSRKGKFAIGIEKSPRLAQMLIEVLLLIVTAICCCCETNSTVAERGGREGSAVSLCSCWASIISYSQLNHIINITITLRNCEILYKSVSFELNILLVGRDNLTNEEHYSINCNPSKTFCRDQKRFWFPKQECVTVAAMIKPTCPRGVQFDPRCHCRPVRRDWIECDSPSPDTRSVKDYVFPSFVHNSTPSSIKGLNRAPSSAKDYVLMAVVVVVAVTTVIVLSIAYMRRKINQSTTLIKERPNNERQPLDVTTV